MGRVLKKKREKPSIVVPTGSHVTIVLDGPCEVFGRFVAGHNAGRYGTIVVTLEGKVLPEEDLTSSTIKTK